MEEIPTLRFIPCRGSTEDEKLSNVCLSEFTPPYPAAKDMPDWYKNLGQFYEHDDGFEAPTAKACPGIFDLLRAGYIIPAWSDFSFKYHSDDPDSWMVQRARALKNAGHWHYHPNDQINGCPINHTESEEFDVPSCRTFVKITSPWFLELDEGYSVMFMQPYYRVSPYYTVLPGIMDPCIGDISNKELNIFIQLNIPDTDIRIKRGDPLVQLIPFRRENFKYELKNEYDADDLKKFKRFEMKRATSIYDSGTSVEQTLKNNRLQKGKNFDAK